MTLTHKLQIALKGIYQRVRRWLPKSRRERTAMESQHKTELETARPVQKTDQDVIKRLIEEKIAIKLAELEQNRQKLNDKRAEAQGKFWELEKQRFERKKALEEQVAAKIKEIGYILNFMPSGKKFNKLKKPRHLSEIHAWLNERSMHIWRDAV